MINRKALADFLDRGLSILGRCPTAVAVFALQFAFFSFFFFQLAGDQEMCVWTHIVVALPEYHRVQYTDAVW